jgi:hypothetical protein
MANPRYHDDPAFYERPGEVVHLHVDANPPKHVVPALPWRSMGMGEEAAVVRDLRAFWLACDPTPCRVCRRLTPAPSGMCDYCSRAQQRDETAKARASQPQPSRPRISIRENWEVWAGEQQRAPVDDFDSGHVRSYETRIA